MPSLPVFAHVIHGRPSLHITNHHNGEYYTIILVYFDLKIFTVNSMVRYSLTIVSQR